MLTHVLSLAVASSEAPPPLPLPPGHPGHHPPPPGGVHAYTRGRRRFRGLVGVALAAEPWHRAIHMRACHDGSHYRVGGIHYPPFLDQTLLCDDSPARSVRVPRGGDSGGVGAHGADGLRAKRHQAARDAARDATHEATLVTSAERRGFVPTTHPSRLFQTFLVPSSTF